MAVTSYEKGFAQGRRDGLRDLVEHLLRKRFGPLLPEAPERLAAMSEEQLLEVGEAMLTAKSLQELGLQD